MPLIPLSLFQPNPIVDALLDNLFKQNRAKVAEGEQPAEGLKDKKEKSEAKKKAKIDKEMRAAHEKTKHYMASKLILRS